MEPRGVSGSGVSEDNQVNSHPSSSNEVVVNDVKQRSATVEPRQPGNIPSTTSSRIPSHVFTPTSTNSMAGWSVNSNESLFSIQMGNMSFNDNLSWMSKSGELDPTIISSPLFEIPVHNYLSTPTAKPTENNKEVGSLKSDDGGDDKDGYGGVNDAAIKTMSEVLREKESQKNNDIDQEPDKHGRTMSQLSDTSCKSFAFPVLTEEADKNNSSKRGAKNKKQPSSHTTPQHTAPETTEPLQVPETLKAETPNKSSTSKATQNGGTKRWFFCFSCFPSCS